MLRRVVTTLVAVSLMLCVATTVLWVRSYWSCDRLLAPPLGRGCWQASVSSLRGGIALELIGGCTELNHPPGFQNQQVTPAMQWANDAYGRSELHLGFGLFSLPMDGFKREGDRKRLFFGHEYCVMFPTWLLFGLTALLPLRRAVVVARRRRPLDTACAVCDYDLRATPERCPECGAVPTPNAA